MEHNQYSQARSSNGQLGMALGPPPAYGSPPTTANFKPTFQATSGSGGYTVQQTTIADPSSPQLPDIFGGLSFSQFGTDNQLPLTPAKPEKLYVNMCPISVTLHSAFVFYLFSFRVFLCACEFNCVYRASETV
jgi:hypothetical protein